MDWLQCSGFHPDDQRTQSSVGLDLQASVVPAWTNGTEPLILSLSGLNSHTAILNWCVFNCCLYIGLCSSLILPVILTEHIEDGKLQWTSWKTGTKQANGTFHSLSQGHNSSVFCLKFPVLMRFSANLLRSFCSLLFCFAVITFFWQFSLV